MRKLRKLLLLNNRHKFTGILCLLLLLVIAGVCPAGGGSVSPATGVNTVQAVSVDDEPEINEDLKIAGEKLADLDRVYINRVIDGDTVEVFGNIRVRLLGVDTPEFRPGQNEYYAAEAAGFSRKHLAGKTVFLSYDERRRDEHGRILAHVFLDDGTFFNARLLREGYARLLIIPPNIKYTGLLRDCAREAIDRRRGLWGGIPEISWQLAGGYTGEEVVVRGKIVDTHAAEEVTFLNFHHDYRHTLTAVIFAEDLEKFTSGPLQIEPAEFYRGQKVLITGRVKLYEGAPEIIIRDPDQIFVIED